LTSTNSEQNELDLTSHSKSPSQTRHGAGWLLSFEFFQKAFLGVTGIISLFFFVEAARLMPVHGENMTAESSTVLIAQRWAQGLQLYTDFRKPPFLIAPFPPGLYALLVAGYKTGIRSVHDLMLLGRWLSLMSLLGIGGVTYFWNRSRGFSSEASLVTPLLFFCFPALLPWAATVRQDFPGLLLAILGVLLAFHRPAWKWIVAAASLAGAAFLIKHSFIAVPTALVLWMGFNRRWKHALLFCLVWFVIVGTVVGYFQWSTPGLMRLNISGGKIAGAASLHNVHESFAAVAWAQGHQVVILMLTFAILGATLSWRKFNNPSWFLSCYFVVSLLFALFVSSFSNASYNHYIEPALVCSLFAPIVLGYLGRNWPREVPTASFLFILMLMLLAPTIDVQRWNMMNDRPDDLDKFVPIVRSEKILTDVPYLATNSAQPQFVETISLRFSEKAGVWSPLPIEAVLQQKQYDLVVLHWSLDDPRWDYHRYARLGPELRRSIRENYSFCAVVQGVYFYTPTALSITSPDEHSTRDCPSLRVQLGTVK
jgi:hypothetical protein